MRVCQGFEQAELLGLLSTLNHGMGCSLSRKPRPQAEALQDGLLGSRRVPSTPGQPTYRKPLLRCTSACCTRCTEPGPSGPCATAANGACRKCGTCCAILSLEAPIACMRPPTAIIPCCTCRRAQMLVPLPSQDSTQKHTETGLGCNVCSSAASVGPGAVAIRARALGCWLGPPRSSRRPPGPLRWKPLTLSAQASCQASNSNCASLSCVEGHRVKPLQTGAL